ncbi:MAG: cytochrome C [Betaproteobacteria bacterium HGW-Betaproteobacteria-18]|nr:MAG: cytochrome C [Betaproteobacteria bacterium HGW-Betaproteobacteria-18]
MKLKLLAVLAGAVVALPVVAADVTYRNDIAPMLKKLCAECHTPEAGAPTMQEFKLDEDKYKKQLKVGPRLDTYEHVRVLIDGSSTGAFMRRLDDGTNPYVKGKAGNMYKYLGETDAERAANLKIVKAWVVGEGKEWNLNGVGQRGDMPPVTLEQLRQVQTKY